MYAEYWTRTIKSELEDHAARDFFNENIPQGVNVISARWALAWKTDNNGFIPKAKGRLIMRGFGQQLDVNYFESFAPTPAI